MTHSLFDSRDPKYRAPFGAVAEGTNIHFRICLPRYLSCSAARLIVDNDDGPVETGNMFWCGMENDIEWWEVDFTPKSPGLYFYYFSLTTSSGSRSIGRTWAGRGELTSAPCKWQLTVYEQDFVTPDWLCGGIIYQIFPDSFNRGDASKAEIPSGRTMQQWGEQPHWQPRADGFIANDHYFGGNLDGIRRKLDYIASLGATCIYLNPIFEAHENHRYNTADYSKIDPMLGTKEDFKRLCAEAEKKGIKVILDGVFSHTGADSVYFNKYGRYPSCGAYNSTQSPYSSWYSFSNWPDKYASWWGITTLPELNETSEGVMNFLTGKGGIVQKWLAEGAGGWRLDVADELPDKFLDALRSAAKDADPEAVIIGEVWEDASNKCAYSHRRRYLQGKQLDSVMNYPFKDAMLGFLTGVDASESMEIILSVLENYPPQVIRLLMNLIDSHDTERAITVLAGDPLCGNGRQWQASHPLSDGQLARGKALMKLASLMQYTLPGIPCLYYGDEAGVQGYRDPFNRACYPWDSPDCELLEWYRRLGGLRRSLTCLAEGRFVPVAARGRLFAFIREDGKQSVLVAVAAGQPCSLELPEAFVGARCLLGSYDGGVTLELCADGFALLCK